MQTSHYSNIFDFQDVIWDPATVFFRRCHGSNRSCRHVFFTFCEIWEFSLSWHEQRNGSMVPLSWKNITSLQTQSNQKNGRLLLLLSQQLMALYLGYLDISQRWKLQSLSSISSSSVTASSSTASSIPKPASRAILRSERKQVKSEEENNRHW